MPKQSPISAELRRVMIYRVVQSVDGLSNGVEKVGRYARMLENFGEHVGEFCPLKIVFLPARLRVQNGAHIFRVLVNRVVRLQFAEAVVKVAQKSVGQIRVSHDGR